MVKDWRTCGACFTHYNGEFGECPNCCKEHAKAKNRPPTGGDGGRKRKVSTLDTQEGNNDL